MQQKLQPDVLMAKMKLSNTHQVLEKLAQEITKIHKGSTKILSRKMIEKEKIDPSALGGGVAVPHLKLNNITRRMITLMTLEKGIHFDAADGKNVDVICCVVSPESDGPVHLRGLARISRMMKNKEFLEQIREAQSEDALRAIFIDHEGWLLAA